jgi:ribose-phosphate pyrophosphokinase
MLMEGAVIIADPNGKGYDFSKKVYEKAKNIGGRRYPLRFSEINKKTFRDCEVRLKVKDNVRRQRCFYIHDSNKAPYEWFTDLAISLEAIKGASASEVNVVLPYTRFARQDRKDQSRVGVNMKVVGEVVSLYGDRGVTVDLHSSQTADFFDIPFDNLHSFPVLFNYLNLKHPDLLENIVVVSPDEGGTKRAGAFRKMLMKKGIGAEMVFCYKERDEEGKLKEIKVVGEVEGKKCLLVDDIIDSGNTMVEDCFALKREGAISVSAYGTHGLFTEGVEKYDCLDRVIVSDSLKCETFSNLEILSLVDLFGEAIYRTIEGDSLSDLFNG